MDSTPLPASLPFPAIPSAVVKLTGPILLAGLFTWGLYGILSIQVYTYYQAFSGDRKLMKTLVYTIYILQTAQILFLTNTAFKYLAAGFGDLNTIDQVGTVWLSVCVIEGIVAFAVQSFYAWRIWVISGRKYPTVLIMLMSVMSFASALVVAANIKILGRFSKLLTHRSTFIEAGIWEASAAVCDVMIAACMTFYLKRRAPEGEQYRQTNDIVGRIIRMTIETGSLTASVAVITIGVTYIPSHPPYYICPITILSGLYATALLAVLNSRLNLSTVPRVDWRIDAQTDHSRSFKMRDMIGSSTSSFIPNGSSIRDAHCHGVVVTVTKEELIGNDSGFVENDQKVSRFRKSVPTL